MLAIETGIAPTLWEEAGDQVIATAFELLTEKYQARG